MEGENKLILSIYENYKETKSALIGIDLSDEMLNGRTIYFSEAKSIRENVTTLYRDGENLEIEDIQGHFFDEINGSNNIRCSKLHSMIFTRLKNPKSDMHELKWKERDLCKITGDVSQ